MTNERALITCENFDKEIIVIYLKKLRKQYRKGNEIYMVLDNARYNRSEIVQESPKN